MSYIKKICLLKQVHTGFANNGKAVSGLVTLERLHDALHIQVNLIAFSPLTTGQYYIVLQNVKGQIEKFPLTNELGAEVELFSNFDITESFAALIASVNTNTTAIAFGKCGEYAFHVTNMLSVLQENKTTTQAIATQDTHYLFENERQPIVYDDEIVATENYYEKAFEEEKLDDIEQTGTAKEEDAGKIAMDEDVKSLFHFTARGESRKDEKTSYYHQVKADLDALFAQYPLEEKLSQALPNAHFVKIEIASGRYYVVGTMEEEGDVRYICYGVPATQKTDLPPPALQGRASFIPLSLFDLQGAGYWILFQDAIDGSCISIQAY